MTFCVPYEVCGVGVTEFFKLSVNEHRGDFGSERQVAGDKDDGAVFPERPGEGQSESRRHRRHEHRQHDANDRLTAPRAERRRRFFQLRVKTLEHRLNRAHDERKADKNKHQHDAERRVNGFNSKRHEKAPEPAVLDVEARVNQTGHSRWKCERQIDQ